MVCRFHQANTFHNQQFFAPPPNCGRCATTDRHNHHQLGHPSPTTPYSTRTSSPSKHHDHPAAQISSSQVIITSLTRRGTDREKTCLLRPHTTLHNHTQNATTKQSSYNNAPLPKRSPKAPPPPCNASREKQKHPMFHPLSTVNAPTQTSSFTTRQSHHPCCPAAGVARVRGPWSKAMTRTLVPGQLVVSWCPPNQRQR